MSRPSTSVIIPTLSDDPLSLESVPDGVETVVVTEGNRAQARNIGARRTRGDVLVFCDDDIVFDQEFFWNWVESTSVGEIAGLNDFDFGFLLTRFLIVRRKDFEQVGGFCERLNHMEDTEFCLNALREGLELTSIDRDKIYHEEHDSVGQGHRATVLNTLYLSLRYPKYSVRLWRGLL